MNILIATDKFKGSLTAMQACEAIRQGILEAVPLAKTNMVPLADGGEDTLEVLEGAINFDRVTVKVSNPIFKPIETWYGLKKDVAYIEMAKASGLLLLSDTDRHAPYTTTLGTGELIADAIKKGANQIYLFVGGSATNDVGIGMASALGYQFLDANNQDVPPVGNSLSEITSIVSDNVKLPKHLSVNLVTDVQNPLFGNDGAARVFASQKGASKIEIEHLENGLKHFDTLASKKFGASMAQIEGAGAAGGLGAGAIWFLDAKVQPGIKTVLNILDFNAHLQNTDVVITGEGKLDTQTLQGKVVKGVIDSCEIHNIPVGIVCGAMELHKQELEKLAIWEVEAVLSNDITLEEAISNAAYYVKQKSSIIIKNILKKLT